MTKLARPRKSKWRPTGIVNPPQRPTNQFGEGMDTWLQLQLWRLGTQMLRNAGLIAKPDKALDDLVDADSITVSGHLRSTWQGTA